MYRPTVFVYNNNFYGGRTDVKSDMKHIFFPS